MKMITIALSALLVAASAFADMLDPAVPADALQITKRAQCGAADGEPAVYYWSGNVYSRVRGEPDRLLFRGEGMNIRQCETVTDPDLGEGYRQISREVMFYINPETNEILRHWDNPWTGETVEVMQIANDPVNQPPQFAVTPDGAMATPAIRRAGPWLFQPLEIPLFYRNPLGGEYQEYIGGQYHAMEIFDFAYPADEMLNTEVPAVYPIVSWVRLSDWAPWMKMRDRQGQMVFNVMGRKLESYGDLPDIIKDEIALNYPDYTIPPPLDDTRPNETTWTAFMKWLVEK